MLTLTACSGGGDPFIDYMEEVNTRGGQQGGTMIEDTPEERAEFEEAVAFWCDRPKEELLEIKQASSLNDPEGYANWIGSFWEHGCGEGFDADMYEPVEAADSDLSLDDLDW